MSTKDIPDQDSPAGAGTAVADEPRSFQVNLSISASDLDFLHQRAAILRAESGRPSFPLASAAYDVFSLGRDMITERAA